MPTPTGKPLLSPIRDKSTIIAENTDLKGKIAALNNTLVERDASISALTARVAALESENGQLKSDISARNGVIPATYSQVVSLDTAGAICAAMEARLGQETCPQEIVRLARKIDALKGVEPQETFASLKAKIEQETDSGKRWKLTERFEALVAAASDF